MSLRAIYVVWLRELIKFWREKARIVTSLVQPAVWLFVMGKGLSGFVRLHGSFSGSYTAFMLPGVMGMTVLFASIFSSVSIIWDRDFGFLKEMLVAPVPRSALVFGKILSGATVAMIQGTLVLVFSPFAGVQLSFAGVVQAMGTMFLLSLSLSGLGIAVGTRMTSMQGFQLVMNFLLMPMYFLSGAIYPLQGLPTWMSVIARIDPLAYGVDALKWALIDFHQFSLSVDYAVLVGLAVVFTLIATVLFKMEG